MVYLLKIVIFYCYVSHNEMVIFNVLEQIQVDDDDGNSPSKTSMVPCTMDDTYIQLLIEKHHGHQ